MFGFQDAMEKRRDENLKTLIYLDTYCLYTVHRAFKYGEVAFGWKMEKLMSLLHKIFEESPSCRDEYIKKPND